jgi:hypothetical protein
MRGPRSAPPPEFPGGGAGSPHRCLDRRVRGCTVPSLDDALSVLRHWKEVQEEAALAWGEAWTDSGLVFTREDGSGLHPASATADRSCARGEVT